MYSILPILLTEMNGLKRLPSVSKMRKGVKHKKYFYILQNKASFSFLFSLTNSQIRLIPTY